MFRMVDPLRLIHPLGFVSWKDSGADRIRHQLGNVLNMTVVKSGAGA